MRIDHRTGRTIRVAVVAVLLALAGLAVGDAMSAAGRGVGLTTRVITLDPSTHGNPEGIAYDPRSSAFYVGAIGDGTIYRGTLDGDTAVEFIPGGEGLQAVGLEVWRGQLYVAGGFTGSLRVYDIDTRELLAAFETGEGGMINDLVVTPKGDVFATDSFRPVLWHITPEQVEAGGGEPEAIPLAPEIEYDLTPFTFNLNGIVALDGGRRLVVVQSNTGNLFRIDMDEEAPGGREIRQIDVEPVFGDGLLLDNGRLVAVTAEPVGLAFIKLHEQAESGVVLERITDPTFRTASTVARARNFYLVVNADFATNTTPFTVTVLPRHGGGDEQ